MMMTTTTTTTTTTTMIRRFFYCYHQALHESKNTSLCGVRTETAPGWRGLSNNNNDIILYNDNTMIYQSVAKLPCRGLA